MTRYLALLLLAGCGTAPCPCDGVVSPEELVHLAGIAKVAQVNGVDRYEAMAHCGVVSDGASECCRWIILQHYGNDGTRDWESYAGDVEPQPFTPDGDWECKDCWWSAE